MSVPDSSEKEGFTTNSLALLLQDLLSIGKSRKFLIERGGVLLYMLLFR